MLSPLFAWRTGRGFVACEGVGPSHHSAMSRESSGLPAGTRDSPGRAPVPDVFFVDGDETRKEEIAEISITFRGEAVIAKVHSCIGAPLLYDDLLADIQETFHDLHFTRGIQYPMLPTLCVVRRVRARTSGGTSEPATAPDVESDVVIVEIVDACAVIWAPSHNFNMWHELIVKMHTSSPPRQDAMRTSLVTSGRPSVHYRLEVDCFS